MKVFFTILYSIIITSLTVAQELSIPEGLKGELVEIKTEKYIQLSWVRHPDSNIGYNLLVKFPGKSDFLLYQKAGVIYDTSYLFQLNQNAAVTYGFALIAINNFPEVVRSKKSKPVEVTVPSTYLPNIDFTEGYYQNEKIILKWSYDNSIPDLIGYRIFQNGQPLNTLIEPEQFQWEDQFTDKGTYLFEISAVTESGLQSRRSQQTVIKIE